MVKATLIFALGAVFGLWLANEDPTLASRVADGINGVGKDDVEVVLDDAYADGTATGPELVDAATERHPDSQWQAVDTPAGPVLYSEDAAGCTAGVRTDGKTITVTLPPDLCGADRVAAMIGGQ